MANFTERKIDRRSFLIGFGSGAVGMVGISYGTISLLNFLENNEEKRFSTFLYPEKNQLTLEEYIQQFDNLFETGLRVSKHGFDDFGNGNNMEGLVWFRKPIDGHVSLQKGLTTNYNVNVATDEPKIYRSLSIQNVNGLEYPKIPGLTNTMISVDLNAIEGFPPKYSVLESSLTHEAKDFDSNSFSREATPVELFEFAKAATEDYNWAIDSNQIL